MNSLKHHVLLRFFCRLVSSKCCSSPPDCPRSLQPIVTLLDSTSKIGHNIALILKQNPLVKELRLYDEEKCTHSIAEDLYYIDTKTIVKGYEPKELKYAVQGAHIVISTGGCQSLPQQSIKCMYNKNLDNVRNVAIFLAEFNPTAVFCIAKPPVEVLVPMASEEYKRTGTYDARKIIGVTTPISMMANRLIAHYANKDPALVMCPVIGGMSPNSTVVIMSQTRPKINFNPDVYKNLQEAIANAEEHLLAKKGAFCYSKAVAICRFINLVLKGLIGHPKSVECAFVAQTGHIGDLLPYMSSIVKLGPDGVQTIHMPKMNDQEMASLRAAVPHIKNSILLGQTFLENTSRSRKTCDQTLKEKLQKSN